MAIERVADILLKMGLEAPRIVIDSREQCPLEFEEFETVVTGLPCGDYGLQGYSDWQNPAWIIERKSLEDLVGSLSKGRPRFMREVEKLRQFQFAAIAIEADQAAVEAGAYRSAMAPEAVLQTLAAIEVRCGLHILWCGHRAGAALSIERLARQYLRGILKDVNRLRPKRN